MKKLYKKLKKNTIALEELNTKINEYKSGVYFKKAWNINKLEGELKKCNAEKEVLLEKRYNICGKLADASLSEMFICIDEIKNI